MSKRLPSLPGESARMAAGWGVLLTGKDLKQVELRGVTLLLSSINGHRHCDVFQVLRNSTMRKMVLKQKQTTPNLASWGSSRARIQEAGPPCASGSGERGCRLGRSSSRPCLASCQLGTGGRGPFQRAQAEEEEAEDYYPLGPEK